MDYSLQGAGEVAKLLCSARWVRLFLLFKQSEVKRPRIFEAQLWMPSLISTGMFISTSLLPTFCAPVQTLRRGGPLRPQVSRVPLLGRLVVANPAGTAHIIG